MTTIAYKDGIIAYDSRRTRDGVIVSDSVEKCVIQSGVAFFLSGATPDMPAMMAAYFGEKPRGLVEASGFAVENGKLWLIGVEDKTGFWKVEKDLRECDSVGCGSSFALAAMDMGATAEEAVRAAMKRDIYTGGTVRLYKIGG